MPKVDVKTIREKCNVMSDAWFEGAPGVKFIAMSQSDFQTEIDAAEADDATIANLEAELKLIRDVRDDKYSALNDKRSKIGNSVAGDPAYGNDSPLYGAMGFVRKSEKKSGLTRKKKPTE